MLLVIITVRKSLYVLEKRIAKSKSEKRSELKKKSNQES